MQVRICRSRLATEMAPGSTKQVDHSLGQGTITRLAWLTGHWSTAAADTCSHVATDYGCGWEQGW